MVEELNKLKEQLVLEGHARHGLFTVKISYLIRELEGQMGPKPDPFPSVKDAMEDLTELFSKKQG